MKTKLIIPTIGTLALLILVGQGCPGQDAATPAGDQGGAMMEDIETSPDSDESVPGEVYGISIPENAIDYRGPTHSDATEQAASFIVPDTTVEELKTYFNDAITEAGWEIVEEEDNPISTNIYAVDSQEREVSVIMQENDDMGGVDVDMLLGASER